MREKDIVGGAAKAQHDKSHGEPKEEKRMSTEVNLFMFRLTV